MRLAIFRALIALMLTAAPAAAQQTSSVAIRQLEKEMLARMSARATAIGGFRMDTSDFDVRLPLHGEPEEIVGPTLHARDALAVGSARIEPLDSLASRADTFNRARYELRLEDRTGKCLVVHQDVTFESKLVRGRRTLERCGPLYMAEVVRRARRLARLPFNAGRLDDRWSAALAATGTVDVYLDSVVMTTSSMILRAAYPEPADKPVVIDSINAGLGYGDDGWSVARASAAIRVDTTLYKGSEWRRGVKRFVIPLDSAFNVSKSWPLFEVHLSVPKTKDNPAGIAWTYAHERKGFFLKRP
ncbi:MAG TPA: hypothetical protein VNC11_16980 [Gemmatimonadaceae bacterium]|jgi:hypothetical protein|nr:hypothetical protein [Gemmatimonadaceae bacterium]